MLINFLISSKPDFFSFILINLLKPFWVFFNPSPMLKVSPFSNKWKLAPNTPFGSSNLLLIISTKLAFFKP